MTPDNLICILKSDLDDNLYGQIDGVAGAVDTLGNFTLIPSIGGLNMLSNLKKIFDTNLISRVVSTDNLNSAFSIVYKNRKKYHHNNDIWYLSKNWTNHRQQIQKKLLVNNYGSVAFVLEYSKILQNLVF